MNVITDITTISVTCTCSVYCPIWLSSSHNCSVSQSLKIPWKGRSSAQWTFVCAWVHVYACVCGHVYICVCMCVGERECVCTTRKQDYLECHLSFFNIVCSLKVNFNKEQITISYVNYLTWFLEYNEHLTKGDFFSAMTPGIFISCSLSKCLLLKFKSNQGLLFNLAEQNIYFKDKTCKNDMLRFSLNFALRFILLSGHIIQTRNDI